ncbi:septal ring lytic transglycosylase RlpA family protein [Caulobacter sp. RL271]|jgi:rare lipoprotein A|uniref:Endolytic peptidoglycan transglycosylase RlpA n=1 Tax=Caulobacter segnis TaxID=88688 RepID=A0ABY5A0L2_9CAUL|nr:septal ring lytic transglycosylase RlpA family protein [Caulobacter segnis]USQ98419.1 septal ring lytic transglycosylase RlpA family protein [Caulobacter segnis]
MNQRIDRVWRNLCGLGLMALAALSLAACATPQYSTGAAGYKVSARGDTTRGSAPRPGSTVGRDGKPLRGTEKPYQINGTWYYPKADPNYSEVGIGSWYGEQFHNRRTANGETFDMDIPSAAHKTLPLPSLVEVTNLDNGQKMIVRVNDRGPFVGDRVIDLSKAAAEQLGYRRQGVARVRVKYIGPAPTSAFTAPRQYAQVQSSAPPPVRNAPRSFDDIKEPTQRVQVLPQRSAPDPIWSPPPAPVQQASAPPVTPPERVPVPAGAYRVQAGSFSSRENAEKAMRQLSGAGRTAIDTIERASGTLYRVTVLAGQDEGEAWSLRDRVESLGYQGATVLRP